MEEQNTNNTTNDEGIVVPENIYELWTKMDYGIATSEDVLEFSKWRESQRKPDESDESLKERVQTAIDKAKKEAPQ